MLKYRRIIQDSARRIAAAVERAAGGFTDQAEHDPEFTGAMLGRMKQAMDGYKTRGVRWTAKVVSGPARSTQGETPVTSFLGVVEFDLPDYHVRKGFIASTAHVERGQNVAPRDWERMADHCRRMLSLTASSFVLVYGRPGVIFVPALSVVSATAPCNPHEFYSRTAMRFYEDHFECFLGDLNLSSTDAATLERLGVGHALFLGASQIQPVDLQMQLKAMS